MTRAALVGSDMVEAGVNDGLALPSLFVFLVVAVGSNDRHLGELALEVTPGLVVGSSFRQRQLCWNASGSSPPRPAYESLNRLAIDVLVLA